MEPKSNPTKFAIFIRSPSLLQKAFIPTPAQERGETLHRDPVLMGNDVRRERGV